MSKIDIKQLNIPNICFSLTDANDKREKKFSKQRKKRGFDDSETWSLVNTICSFTLPRLKRYKKVCNCVPPEMEKDEWDNILDKIILSFELIVKNEGSWLWSEKEANQVDEGVELFSKWFLHLWW